MTSPRELRDRLCDLEPQNPELRGRYDQALRAMLQRRLSLGGKVFVGCVGVSSLGIAVFIASQGVAHPELPGLAQIGLAAGVLFSLAWTALCGWTLWRGAWYGKVQPSLIAVLAWVLAVLLETLFLVLAPEAPNPYLATIAVLAGMVILIGAGVQFLGTCIQQSDLRTREALLRMEFRLAELAEEIAKNRRPD